MTTWWDWVLLCLLIALWGAGAAATHYVLRRFVPDNPKDDGRVDLLEMADIAFVRWQHLPHVDELYARYAAVVYACRRDRLGWLANTLMLWALRWAARQIERRRYALELPDWQRIVGEE